MPKKTTAVDELGTMKARHDGSKPAAGVGDLALPAKGGGILGPSVWIALAVILALGSTTALTLAYRQLRDISARENAVRAKEERVAELDQKLSDLDSQAANSEAALEQLKGEVKATEKYAAKGAAAGAAYRIYSTMVPSMKTESEALSSQIDQRKEERAQLAGVLARERASLSAILAAQSNTVSKIEQLQAEVDNYDAQSQKLREAIAKSKVVAASHEQTVRQLETTKTKLGNTIDTSQAALNRDTARHDEIKGTLPGLKQIAAGLRVELAAATNTLASLQPELTRLSGRVHEQRQEALRLEAEKTKLEEQISDLKTEKAERDALAKEKAKLAGESSALKTAIEKQQTQLADTSGQASTLKKDIRELEQQRLDLERAVNQLIGEKRALEAQRVPQE